MKRVWARNHPLRPAIASWYNDGGPCWHSRQCATASGVTYYYGVANLWVDFGTKVRVCRVHCVTARVDDRGPYVGGRDWDLNQNVARDIGFDGVGVVRIALAYPEVFK